MCLHYNIPEPEYDEEERNADFGIYMPLEQLQENEGGGVGRVDPDLHAARRSGKVHLDFWVLFGTPYCCSG